jgi:hypothetical protein
VTRDLHVLDRRATPEREHAERAATSLIDPSGSWRGDDGLGEVMPRERVAVRSGVQLGGRTGAATP